MFAFQGKKRDLRQVISLPPIVERLYTRALRRRGEVYKVDLDTALTAAPERLRVHGVSHG